jgi:hypothetical protein
VYGKGTLALVGFSAAASLPAQIIHFVTLHWMLFPIGPAIEGLAWVMAAGVAYADEKKLAPWVRWLLRGLTLGAASFAAYINYTYGLSLETKGLTYRRGADRRHRTCCRHSRRTGRLRDPAVGPHPDRCGGQPEAGAGEGACPAREEAP